MEGLGPYSSAEFKRVRAVQFGIISPDEMVRQLARHRDLRLEIR